LPELHPALQHLKSNLGVTMYLLGDLEGARSLFEQVYANSVKMLPDDHPDLQKVRENLAGTLAAISASVPPQDAGTNDRARRFDGLAREYIRGLREVARSAIAESSSREAEERVASAGASLSTALSLAAGAGFFGDDENREREVFLASESMRGTALAWARLARAARSDPNYEATRARARAASEALAAFAQGGSSADEFARAREALEAAERDLVQRASRIAGGPGQELDPDLDVLAARLHPGEALVGYRRYLRTTIARGGPSIGTSVDSLCAFVLRSDRKLSRVELGPLAAIETAVGRWREAISVDPERGLAPGRDRGSSAETRGAELRALVFDPLVPALAGADRILVAPDDVLHAVALDALPAPSGSEPLGSRIRFETRTSLLEVIDEPLAHAGEASLLAIGDASFDGAPVDLAAGGKEAPVVSQARIRAPADAGILRGGTWERGFAVLPETRAEVATIAETFSEVFGDQAQATLLERREASRENLFRIAPSASFLHVATHGWFAPDSVRSVEDPTPLDPQSGLGIRTSTADRVRGMAPMLLTGVALAGANLPPDPTGRIPGLVTAEELAALDLSDCELAVLSACDTNVGVRRGGQGVASLQRALHQAGARSVITSIWKVPDEATKELMIDFYRRMWAQKKPKGQALWEAKMKIRGTKSEAGNARYSVRDWAGWVLTGATD
jgi:CHAT domain-containing protein